jgi:methylthioribose-1-phosphate isomerase
LDQRLLPVEEVWLPHTSASEVAASIRNMVVRGAPAIGISAAYGAALAATLAPDNGWKQTIEADMQVLAESRPTAVNLRWALDQMRTLLDNRAPADRAALAWARAAEICDEDVEICKAIGRHGLALIEDIAKTKPAGEPVNVLTHCNAGWLATVDWGTATAPIYMAYEKGVPVHVWVDETRPRNQGASLTAWELGRHGVDHTLIADNVGGHLMQHGLVDLCIVGTDRTTARGDVCNKIGTYLKALAAKDNDVPFYVALPSTTIDWTVVDGVREIPIEQRSGTELTRITGRTADGAVVEVDIAPEGVTARNDAFDVTPARLVTGLITERGVVEASDSGLRKFYNDDI